MKYINEILWLASWPVIIYVAYRICFWAIKRYEKKQETMNIGG